MPTELPRPEATRRRPHTSWGNFPRRPIEHRTSRFTNSKIVGTQGEGRGKEAAKHLRTTPSGPFRSLRRPDSGRVRAGHVWKGPSRAKGRQGQEEEQEPPLLPSNPSGHAVMILSEARKFISNNTVWFSLSGGAAGVLGGDWAPDGRRLHPGARRSLQRAIMFPPSVTYPRPRVGFPEKGTHLTLRQ
ncbi:hypothetical protein E2C01_024734 [Portunus trituberculatus]|uniref:Uncharacterized protein n=1 Tax=Portunus trituberculatus TaxID=210409 RepID=A0A5B7EDK8_PORTR|nr:hypothetical protein [Portunus trituberculatus]